MIPGRVEESCGVGDCWAAVWSQRQCVEAESRMVGRVTSRREHGCVPTRTRVCLESGRGGQCGESPLLRLGTLGSKLVIPDKLFIFHFPE